MSWEVVIGLEVHVQLNTRTKLFSPAANRFGDPPNTNVRPVDLGLPGTLPVLNDRAVDMALLAAVALECDVQPTSLFARKHYFYPDLPKGYQISQYSRPLALGGRVPVEIEGRRCEIPLARIHLEEDAGKSLHAEGEGGDSRIDLNRCGTPLIEIVSRPEIRRPEETGAFLESLRRIVQYLEISDGDMSQGSLRCDANVSVRPAGDPELGTKTEVKNLNSIKAVEKAVAEEARRQIGLLEKGGEVSQATLLWDEKSATVRRMRSKEQSHDYRYFPEPDLMPLEIDAARLHEVRSRLPELPFARRDRFVADYGIPDYDAGVLTSSRPLAEWFEAAAKGVGDAKVASNWTMGEVRRILKERGVTIEEFPVRPEGLAELVGLVENGEISGSIAKTVFAKMVDGRRGAREIVSAEGLAQISDAGRIESVVERVIADHPDQVEEFRRGKEHVLGFLMGQVMKSSRGQLNPQIARSLLRERLQSEGTA